MNSMGDNNTITARRIGALKRMIDASLMELTEVEVLINARCRLKQAEGGELERTRLGLTNAIVEMDAELKQLQSNRSVVQPYDGALDPSDDGRCVKAMLKKNNPKGRKASSNLYRE